MLPPARRAGSGPARSPAHKARVAVRHDLSAESTDPAGTARALPATGGDRLPVAARITAGRGAPGGIPLDRRDRGRTVREGSRDRRVRKAARKTSSATGGPIDEHRDATEGRDGCRDADSGGRTGVRPDGADGACRRPRALL
ncbi:hypothetical protein Shyhy02_50960 [Streptomyces hygroscopicus subsp. hygroscopicus]|nr:hypothetical protein Shyhy02_50960 [Streptomyces hygroscopicus subsp. hygroscopicus]